jgi:hypothetical protein
MMTGVFRFPHWRWGLQSPRPVLGEPGSKILTVEPGHLTLTGKEIGIGHFPTSPATLTLTGNSIVINRAVGVVAADLTLIGSTIEIAGSIIVSFDPGDLTLLPNSISLRDLDLPSTRAPLLTRKTGNRTASYWRGMPLRG